jgi:alpha-N-arabinofuranosidase
VQIDLRGNGASGGSGAKFSNGQIITAENMNEHNTFIEGEKIKIKDFKTAKQDGAKINVNLPPKSVVTLELA